MKLRIIAPAVAVAAACVWRLRAAAVAERKRPPKGDFVTVDEVRLHYTRKGSGQAVVLLHGSDGSMDDFSPRLTNLLCHQFEVIALDRPGHGYSDKPVGEPATPAVNARLLRAALSKLDVVRPILVCHSWSATVALHMALLSADDVAGIVAVSGWFYASRDYLDVLFRLARVPLLGPLLCLLMLPPIRRALIRYSLTTAFWPESVPPAYAGACADMWQRRWSQTGVVAQENTLDAREMERLAPEYRRLTTPVVLVAGQSDRCVPTREHTQRFAEAVPGTEVLLLPGVGHQIPCTHPEAIATAIQRCADMVPAGRMAHYGTESHYSRVRALVYRFGWNAMAYQILNSEMEHWFDSTGEAVVGFVTRHGVRVAAGAPVCAADRLAAVTREFEESAAAAGDRACWFGASRRMEDALAGTGRHARIVVGAQPYWRPAEWQSILRRHASLRAQISRARNKRITAGEWSSVQAAHDLQLTECLEEWIRSRAMPTLQFLTAPVPLNELRDRRIFVAETASVPVAYLIATPVPERNGWLVEQIVRGNRAPNGAVELLVDTAMNTFAREASEFVTLGLAPLSRRAVPAGTAAPGVRLMMAWARSHGRRFYNFEGLDAFKAKFKPHGWEPILAISNEDRFSFRSLYAVGAAFSREPLVWAAGKAAGAAVRQELAWARRRFEASIHGRQGPGKS